MHGDKCRRRENDHDFGHSRPFSGSTRRGAESNQNFRSSIYASGDPIISYQIQISLASLIIQCY